MPAYIRLKGVSLSVPLYLQKERAVRGWASAFLSAAFDPPKRTWAQLLHDIDLEVEEGDRVAILGRNGAGKSTLLRVLNGVFTPTSGTVEVGGSRQALLNISLGFSNDATVRENVLLRGTAMKIPSSLLREHMDDILQFADLREKATHRLHTLSAGQRMRLGFAITTAFQHDIMLMDEWVGAGDADFMNKAAARMASRVDGSKIVMLASHSPAILRKVCNKGIVLEGGRLIFQGDIVSALNAYSKVLGSHPEPARRSSEATQGHASVAGYIESIVPLSDELIITGWAINAEDPAERTMEIRLGEERLQPTSISAVRRPDVAEALGLREEDCGFAAQVSLAGREFPPGDWRKLEVSVGKSPDEVVKSLTLTDTANLQLADLVMKAVARLVASTAQASDADDPDAVCGYVDSVRRSEEGIELIGWWMAADGSVPTSMQVELNGVLLPPERIVTVRRADVAAHFGLEEDRFGFVATFGQANAFRGHTQNVRALASRGNGHAVFPLSLTDAAKAELQVPSAVGQEG